MKVESLECILSWVRVSGAMVRCKEDERQPPVKCARKKTATVTWLRHEQRRGESRSVRQKMLCGKGLFRCLCRISKKGTRINLQMRSDEINNIRSVFMLYITVQFEDDQTK